MVKSRGTSRRRGWVVALVGAAALVLLAVLWINRRVPTGTIEIDGSSTVYPITEAVAEEFGKVYPRVRVNVGISGTGGGFKRFVVGETQISDASRPIKDSEKQKAEDNNIQWIELPIAYDGLSVVVHRQNTWVNYITVPELKRLWEPGSAINRWNQVRPDWPDQPINLYGPGTDSGTFDYFTEAIVGEEGASRPDYTASEDDNFLVQGIAGDRNALGYLGYAYYIESKENLELVAIDSGNGPVLPSEETIRDGTYEPLSRPLFIYVNQAALQRPGVKAFVEFYLEQALVLVKEVGYIPLPDSLYIEGLAKIQQPQVKLRQELQPCSSVSQEARLSLEVDGRIEARKTFG